MHGGVWSGFGAGGGCRLCRVLHPLPDTEGVSSSCCFVVQARHQAEEVANEANGCHKQQCSGAATLAHVLQSEARPAMHAIRKLTEIFFFFFTITSTSWNYMADRQAISKLPYQRRAPARAEREVSLRDKIH